MWAIARRELRSLFMSPLAWSILIVVQVLLAWLFLSQLDAYLMVQGRLATMSGAPGVTDIVAIPVLGSATIVMLLVTPLLTMRLLSEEQRSGTLQLLLSAPVSTTRIVLGKYIGISGFLLVMLAITTLMISSLLLGTALDIGKLASALLGLLLLLCAYASAGLYLSARTAQPTVAGVTSFGLLLLLWMLDWAGDTRNEISGLFAWLSLATHYESFVKGLVDTRDIAYYLLFIGVFLTLTIRHLEAKRLHP